WFIDKTVGIQAFKDDPSLSDDEIAAIGAWVENGAPMGDPGDMPPIRKSSPAGAWMYGTPDLIVSSPVITVTALGADWRGPLENVQVATGVTEDRWVKAVEVREFRPDETRKVSGNRADGGTPSYFTVHHAVIEVLRAEDSLDFDLEGAVRVEGGLPRSELN